MKASMKGPYMSQFCKNYKRTVSQFKADIAKLSHLSKCLYIIWTQKLKKLFAFSSWFKHRFPWSKEETFFS